MKLSTVRWFFKNPQFIPQAFQIIKRRIFEKPDRYGEDKAIHWCWEKAQSIESIFIKLGVESYELTIDSAFPEYFQFAHERVAKTPVTMGGPGGLTTLYNLVRHYQPKRIVETGVAYGWSSLAILLAIKDSKNASLISVDMPYVNMNNESFVGTVVRGDLRSRWTLLRKADRHGIPEAIKLHGGSLDFVHYDSDKSYSGRRWAYPVLWQALRPGGIFISDDIQDNLGFKEFCTYLNLEPLIHNSEEKFVGILQKPNLYG